MSKVVLSPSAAGRWTVLYSIDMKRIHGIPKKRREQYDVWREALGDAAYDAVVAALRRYVDELESENKCFTSSYIPGDDWTMKVWAPIYYACGLSVENSGYCFGLVVWEFLVQDANRCWMFKPAAKGEEDVLGMTYWQIACPE